MREEIVDVTGEIMRRPETIGHHVDEVEQFKPFGRIRKSLSTDIRSLVVSMSMPHFANLKVLCTLGDERSVNSMCTR